jgi:hypothetical protein
VVADVAPVTDAVAAPGAPSSTRDPGNEADHFARTTFRPNRTSRVKLAEIRQAYHEWCRREGIAPLDDRDIGQALNALFSEVGLYRDGNAIVGIGWRGDVARPLDAIEHSAPTG